jgi:hypothetical protein
MKDELRAEPVRAAGGFRPYAVDPGYQSGNQEMPVRLVQPALVNPPGAAEDHRGGEDVGILDPVFGQE